MKMTTNRKLTLLALQDTTDGTPPNSAYTIGYILGSAFSYKWIGYEEMKSVPNKQQIHRTLRDLWRDGLIVGSRVKEEGYNGKLPHWVIRYQLSSEVELNYLVSTCDALHRKVRIAKHGVNFFGTLMDMGLPPDEVVTLSHEVKRLIQKTHPDKVSGLDAQFKQMIECRDWIKSGIPMPTPTHQAVNQQSNNRISHG